MYIPSKNRVCGYCFKNEKDLPAGQKLLTCSKCHEMCYIDRASQVAHWPLHKMQCCSRERDAPVITGEGYQGVGRPFRDLWQCLEVIGNILTNPTQMKGRILLLALQEYRRYLIEASPAFADSERVGGNTLNCILNPLRELWMRGAGGLVAGAFFDMFFSVPGVANYFLDETIFLSEAMKDRQAQDVPPTDADIRNRSNQLPRPYCEFLFQLFHCTSVNSVQSVATGRGFAAYAGPLGAASMRTAMAVYKNRYCRCSMPPGNVAFSFGGEQKPIDYTSMLWGLILPWMAFRQDPSGTDEVKKLMGEEELVPGINVVEILRLLVSNDGDPRLIKYFYRLFPFLLTEEQKYNHMKTKAGMWKTVSERDRIELLDRQQTWDPPHGAHYERPDHIVDPKACTTYLLLGAGSTNTLLKLYQEIKAWSEPSTDQRTADLIEDTRQSLLDDAMPMVSTYLEVVEPRYQQRMDDSNQQPQSFPEVLMTEIAEFSLPDTTTKLKPSAMFD